MKTSIILYISALATLCAAQFGLPDCAQKCVTDAKLPAQCSQLDVGCICSSNEWLSNLSCCISDNCPPKDQADTIVAAQKLCKGGGVTLASTLPPCATATAASSKTDTSSSSATAGAASGSSSGSATGSSTSASQSASSSALPSNAAGQPGAAAGSPSTPTSTGAANQLTVSGMGAVGIACAAIGLL